MIKVYKEILTYLNIDHTFITEEQNYFCNPLELSTAVWKISIAGEIILPTIKLNIKYKSKYIVIPVLSEKIETGIYLLRFQKIKQNKALNELNNRIKQLEADYSNWEKRKEVRYEIGLKNSLRLGLRSKEQKIVVANKELPCLINNISFSGINVTTVVTKECRLGMDVIILLKFTNPIEQIAVKGKIQFTKTKIAKENERLIFAILSIQFIETTLSFKHRLGDYVKNALDNTSTT